MQAHTIRSGDIERRPSRDVVLIPRAADVRFSSYEWSHACSTSLSLVVSTLSVLSPRQN